MTEKVVLGDIISGYNLSLINDNFQKIEDELNNNVLYRDAPEGAPNQLEVDIDANGKRIYNLPKPTSMNEPVRVYDLITASDVVPVTEWFVDTFVGNGSTTVFPLTNETQSDGSVFVYLNGLAKTLNTDYTVVDNKVVFSVAPSNGVQVVVHYGMFVGSGAGVTSVGSGASIVKDGDGVLRSIQGVGEVVVNINGDVVEVGTNAQNNIGTSLGTGAPVYAGKTGATLQFKSVKAGTNVTITESADSITVAASGSGGSGEANTASNVGTGVGVFKAKDGVDLKFKSLKAGANITLTPSTDEILIEASGSGGGTPFADISAYGAVGDFVPAAGSTGTGTINDGAVNSAISSGKPLWIPAGNFLVSSAVQTALNNVTTTGPGTLWISTNVGITKMGKMLVIGTNRSHEMQSVGGIKLGGESGDGFRWYMGHHNWSQIQPTKYGAPTQFQLYPSIVCGLATTQATDIINAVHGTFDSTRMTVGDHIGFSNKVYKIAQIISPTQLRLVTFTGVNPGFTTNSTHRTFYHSYETATGTCNTSGTAVTYVSGDQYPYGLSFDHMYAIINGVKYDVTLGPEGLSANQLQLSVSAGTQTNVPIEFRRCWGPYAYVTLFRLQGLGGGIETNAGLYLNIRNEAVLFNSGYGSTYYGDMRINANTTYVGHGDGTGGTEIAEFGLNHASLGGLFGAEALRAVRVNNAVNRIEVKGADTGFAANIASRGTDPNPDMGFDLQGNGTFRFTAGTFGRTVLEVSAPSGTNTWPTTSAGSGVGSLSVNSSLTNADMAIAPKGITGRLLLKKVPICSLTRTGAMTFANNAGTTISWDTEISDVHGMHTPGASTVTAPVTGMYRINASYQISATSDANGVIATGMYLLKNGAAVKASPISRHRGPNSSAFVCGGQFNGTIELTAGDTVEMQGYYGGASATASLDNSFTFTCFDVELITAY